jgi:WD40 repeat protein
MLMVVEIFCCYAHEDALLLKRLKKHIIPLQREGLISILNDTDISPGTNWEEEIDKHLNTAQIILLLISPDFIASEYCYSEEMKQAMKRHDHGKTRVIPIILRYVDWQKTPFGKLQALPAGARPITSWHNLDEAFFNVEKGIRKAVEELKGFTLRDTLETISVAVRSLTISPNGRTLASGGLDSIIKVWNLHTGQLLHTLTGHSNHILSLTISPDEQTLASGGADSTIKVWNLHTGQLLRTLIGHTNSVLSVAISQDGQTLVSGGQDFTLKVWNVYTGQMLHTLVGHQGTVYSVAISPDGQTLASGSADSTIKIWQKK